MGERQQVEYFVALGTLGLALVMLGVTSLVSRILQESLRVYLIVVFMICIAVCGAALIKNKRLVFVIISFCLSFFIFGFLFNILPDISNK